MKRAYFQNRDFSPVLKTAAPIYILGNLYLLFVAGLSLILLLLANLAYLAMLTWLTIRITGEMPEEELPERPLGLWIAQLAVVAAVILLTALNFLGVPLWSDLVGWFHDLGEAWLPVYWFGGPGNAVANPLQYFVIPFILLLLLGATPAELGLGKGHKVWTVSLLWLALPLGISLVMAASGSMALQILVRRIISNFFQNGFFEEFLFRGALQTRLRRFLSRPWALAVQAVVFGVWHLRSTTMSFDGNVLAGLALCLVSQSVIGFVLGLVFDRTRNLAAPTAAHIGINLFGQMFG